MLRLCTAVLKGDNLRQLAKREMQRKKRRILIDGKEGNHEKGRGKAKER